jgi:thioredoxin-related protein
MRICLFLSILAIMAFSCNRHEKGTAIISNTADTTTGPELFSTLINQSRETYKNIFMVFGFESCGWCRLFDKYHHDPAVKAILNTYFIIAKIDYDKTPGGKELYREYGSEGFPSWTIMDSTKRVLINSNAPIPGVVDERYNIGYPYGTDKIKYYLYALKTAAPTIKKSECDLLSDRLKYYKENQ